MKRKLCPHCGIHIPTYWDLCLYCGNEIEEAHVEAVPVVTVKPTIPT